MQKIIIADTSCLILFTKIDELDILDALFDEIIVTPQIAEEFGRKLPPFIQVKAVDSKETVSLYNNSVDMGESSAMAIALEIKDALLIIDDAKARKLAQKSGLSITGTVGVIVLAHKMGVLKDSSNIIGKIEKTNFRLSQDMLDYLRQVL